MKFGQILERMVYDKYFFNVLVQCWRLETNSRSFYDFIKLDSCNIQGQWWMYSCASTTGVNINIYVNIHISIINIIFIIIIISIIIIIIVYVPPNLYLNINIISIFTMTLLLHTSSCNFRTITILVVGDPFMTDVGWVCYFLLLFSFLLMQLSSMLLTSLLFFIVFITTANVCVCS